MVLHGPVEWIAFFVGLLALFDFIRLIRSFR